MKSPRRRRRTARHASTNRCVERVVRTFFAVGLAFALIAVTVVATPRALAQAIDCDAASWEVAGASQFEAAVDCWHNTSVPGAYSIELTGDVDARATIRAKPRGFHLTLDGRGSRLEQGLELRDDEVVVSGFFGFELTNVEVTSANDWALDLQTQVGVALDSVTIDGAQRGILSLGPLHVRNSTVRETTEGLGSPGAIDVSGPTLIEGTSIIGNLAPAITIDGGLRSIQVVIRYSHFADNQAGVVALGGAELAGDGDLVNPHPQVVIDGTSIIDNDRVAQRGAGVIGGDVTILNSTISSHDGPDEFGYGVVALDNAPGIVVANSTVSGNGFDLVGSVTAISSIVTRCEIPTPGLAWGVPLGRPVDGQQNLGGCFGGAPAEELPLSFVGCGPFLSCGDVMPLDPESPAIGAGRCSDVPVLNPAFMVRHPIDDPLLVEDGVPLPPLVIMGNQSSDQFAESRFSCDVGAVEFDGRRSDEALTILSWQVDALICAEFLCGSARAYDVAEVFDENFASVAVLHGFLRDRFAGSLEPEGKEQVDALEEELRALSPSMHWRFFGSGETVEGNESGTLILSRRPVLDSRTQMVGQGAAVHELILRATEEPVRVVAVEVMSSPTPCVALEAFLDWYSDQTPMTTVVSLQGTELDETSCWAEVSTTFVMACMPADIASECPAAPGSYLGHDPLPGSGVTRGFEQQTVQGRLGIEAAPVVAGFSLEDPVTDIDGDRVADAVDNCPLRSNALQTDTDTDGIGDTCDSLFNGDADCDARRDIVDALLIAQFVAGVRTGVNECSGIDAASQINVGASDANRDRVTDIIDALLVAQCDAGIFNEVCLAP